MKFSLCIRCGLQHRRNVKKEYHQDGYYVTGVSISDGLLELDRVVRQENGYADAPEDHIMNGEQQSQELVTGRLATVDDRREQQFLLEFSTSGKTQSLLTLTPKYIYSTLRTDLTMSYDTGSADLYYVYGKGKLIAILSSPAEAVQLADENVGVVLTAASPMCGSAETASRACASTRQRCVGISECISGRKRAEGVTR